MGLSKIQIEDLKIGKLEPGKYIEITGEELFKLLKMNPSSKSAGSKESISRGQKSTKENKIIVLNQTSKFWSNKSSSKTFKNKPTTKPSKKSDNKR